MKDGSGRWLPSRWEDLLGKALIALDSLEGHAGPWTFGGGTALAQILGHRISYDVDIFLDSSTVLRGGRSSSTEPAKLHWRPWRRSWI